MRTTKLCAVVVIALAFGAGLAHADKKTDAEAKRLYLEGTKAYSLGDFPKAIESYKRAFDVKPDPVLLYNIAQAYRLSSDFGQSLFFYKSFLRNMPDAANREEVEGRISEMESAMAKQKATASAPPTGPVAPGGKLPAGGDASTIATRHTTETEPGTTTTPTEGKTTRLPSPDKAAEAGEAGSEVQPPVMPEPIDSGGHHRPIYKKWWFWAGVGAVAVGAVVIVAAGSGGSSGAPGGHFGSQDVF